MKRILRLTLFTAAIMILTCVPAMAAEVIDTGSCGADGDNLTYTLTDDGVLTIQGKGEMADGCLGFYYNYQSDIISVKIGDGVTSIGDSAFYGCSSLINITIPNSVTNIGEEAFAWCSSLTGIFIPASVTDLDRSAFDYCNLSSITVSGDNKCYDSRNDCNAIIETVSNCLIIGCKNSVIPNSVTSIGDSAFYCCSSLTNITIPDSVTSIGDFAFYCSSLTNITIPDSVTSIGDFAFFNCSSLTNITIPDSVTSIGKVAFSECSSLINITIPDSVTSIGDSAFYCCSSLTNIMIPDSVTSIGERAFYWCSSLSKITIPNSVTSIEDYTFYGCSSLTNIDIPNSVTSIRDYAFHGCSSLKDVYYSGTEEQWNAITIDSENDCLKDATIHFSSEIESGSDSVNISIWDMKNNPIISLQSFYNGNYLRADISDFDHGVPTVDSGKIQLWEEFELTPCGNGKYALRSCANRKYLSCTTDIDLLTMKKQCRFQFSNDFITDDSLIEFKYIGTDSFGQDVYAIYFLATNAYLPNRLLADYGCSSIDSAERFSIILRDNNEYTATEKNILARIGNYWTIQSQIGDGNTSKLTSLGYSTMYYKKGDSDEKKRGTIKIDNMECAIGVNKVDNRYEMIITFQGTGGYGDDSIDDGRSNLGGGPLDGIKSDCHSGYWNMMEKLSNNQSEIICNGYNNITLEDLINKAKEGNNVHFTILGHSMGGAIAQCYAKNLFEQGVPKSAISGRTFNSALAITYDDDSYKDWYNICVSSDTVPNGLVPGTILNDYGMHRIGKTIWLYDNEPHLNTDHNVFLNIANAKHCMDQKLQELLKQFSCYWGHSNKASSITKATLTENGKIYYTCSKCNNNSTKTIYAPKTFTLSTMTYTYDGKVKKPSVKILDSKGKTISSSYYSLTYSSGRKNVGSYTVKVSFKERYKGSKTLTFKINPKGTSISSLTALSKGFTVKWAKRTTQTSGYQIRYSTKSDMSSSKTVTISSTSTVSKKITGLTAKKKYYVQVRTYKTVNGTKYYSGWCDKKSVTTK